MHAHVVPQTLSPALLVTLRTHWLVDDCSLTSVDADRRIRAYQDVAKEIAVRARRQLVACGAKTVHDWLKHRALIIGYINGMSEAVLRESGESSRWAIALMYMSAMLALLEAEWDEVVMGGEAQRLWNQRNPAYLIGIRAADADHAALRHERMSTALAAAIIEREKRIG